MSLALPSWMLVGAAAVGSSLAALAGGLWWARSQLRHRLSDEVERRTRRLEDVSRRFRLMADNAYDLIAVVDGNGRFDYINGAFTRILGFSKEELREVSFPHWVHPKNRDDVTALLTKVVRDGSTQELLLKLPHANGNWIDVELVAKGLPDGDWVVRNVVLHARDISQRKKIMDELARNEQRFKDFAGSSADWLWETDTNGFFRYVSPGVNNVLGYDPDELIGLSQLDILFAHEEDTGRDVLVSRLDRQQPYRELEFWTRSKAGERVCLRLSGMPVFDSQQDFTGYRGAASNITASKIERDNVFRLATTDHLTGLLNGARFKEELDRAVVLARRHNTTGVVLFIDLDRFKEINDTHGHEAGDKILMGVAHILRDSVRSTDIVARRGGDEFSIIMHNIDVESAAQKVQKMIERVKAFYVEYHGTRLTITMSVGMVQYPQDEKDAEQILVSADLAMYRAKDMGRNRLYVDASDATSETMGSVRAQLKWVERLRYCLEHDEFEMHYQAIVPARRHQRPLFEALLRIYDETGKVGSPALYIDAAEHFGLIQQLDLAVVRSVFATQRAVTDDGFDVDITINLSSRTLGDPAVVPKLKKLMDEYKIDPNRIIFEVTETMALHDPAQMRDISEIRMFINSLREMGFRFALDDFGTGFTSFRYLKVLKVDLVKIDGEYIKNIMEDAEDRLFVESMVFLCNGLGIDTIAEFVENQEINQMILDLGVGAGQGWLYAKPQPDLRDLVTRYRGKTMTDYLTTLPLLDEAKKPKDEPSAPPAPPAPEPTPAPESKPKKAKKSKDSA